MAMRCEMLLYMAARAQMMAEVIRPALDAGKLVLSDRFVSSTLAYQLGGDGLTADEIRAVADVAIRGRWPDLTIILDMPTQASMDRVLPKFSLFPDDPDAGLRKGPHRAAADGVPRAGAAELPRAGEGRPAAVPRDRRRRSAGGGARGRVADGGQR